MRNEQHRKLICGACVIIGLKSGTGELATSQLAN